MYFHLILFSYIVAFAFDVSWKKKPRRFPYGYGAHNVCSSTAPVFNFLTWKAFPSKENSHFHSDTRSMILTLYVTPSSLHLTWSPLHPPSLVTPPSTRVRCVICSSCGSWFYVCWLLRLAFYFAVASERTAHKLLCLLSLMLAVTFCVCISWLLFFSFFFLFFYISLLLCWCFKSGLSRCSSASTVFVRL